MSPHPQGPNRLSIPASYPSSEQPPRARSAQSLNARFLAYARGEPLPAGATATGDEGIAASSPSSHYTLTPASAPLQQPIRRLPPPPSPAQQQQLPLPPRYHQPTSEASGSGPSTAGSASAFRWEEASSSQSPSPSLSPSPSPSPGGRMTEAQRLMMEAADEEEALRLSLEEMDLQEKRRRLREEEAEEACRMIESVGSNGRGTLGWQDRAGDETYDGLGGGPGGRGSEPYSHIPPIPSKDKPPSPSPVRQQATTTSPSDAFVSAEHALHADLIAKLKAWQSGQLPASLEWHEVVPEGVRESLSKEEVERQGLLWEIFRSEQEYVKNLEGGLNGFFTPLASAPPNVMPPQKMRSFLDEVFHNMSAIFPKHSRMVYRLQERQIALHPIVSSVSDILIDALFDLLQDYERYLKHYPYAEARLRREVTRNEALSKLVDKCAREPVVRKQELGAFLVSPLGRLSKLGLVLRRLLQITPKDHEDADQIPVVLDQIDSMLRSVQPGVDAATAKVKSWQMAQKLLFRRGERVDLDLDLSSDQRALLSQGPICRRNRTERDWHGWTDLYLILFDNYLLITRQEVRPGGDPKDEDDRRYAVVSRPIPLEFLQLIGNENDPGEHRRDMIIDYQRTKPLRPSTILDRVTQPDRGHLYPFHLEHRASGKGYSLYVESEALRRDWISKIKEQILVRRVLRENNQLFSIQGITYFPPRRSSSTNSPSRPLSIQRLSMTTESPSASSASDNSHSHSQSYSYSAGTSPTISSVAPFTPLQRASTSSALTDSAPPSSSSSSPSPAPAKIICGATFTREGRDMLVIGDSTGVTFGYQDDSASHRQLIESTSVVDLFILDEFDRLLVLAMGCLYSFNLSLLLPTSDPDEWPRTKRESGEVLNGWGENVTMFRVGALQGTPLVIYCCYNRIVGQTTLYALEPFHPPRSQLRGSGNPLHRDPAVGPTYRPFAQAFVPGQIYNIGFFDRCLYIPTAHGFVVLDPLNLSANVSAPCFPSGSLSTSDAAVYATLKSKVTSTKALLMHRLNDNASILVYEGGAVWVDRHGVILNQGSFVVWETKPAAASVRSGAHVVLFSTSGRFLEIRNAYSGRLEEVLEGVGLRLVGDDPSRNLLGSRIPNGKISDSLFQLVETVALPISARPPMMSQMTDSSRASLESYRMSRVG